MDNEQLDTDDNNNNNNTTTTTNSSPSTSTYNDIIDAYSFSSASASAFDSSSCRLSSSSSISGWAPPSTRARSSSVSSHGSNDSVNLDALIAGGSDINEECPLDLEEGDDLMTVDWSKQSRLLEVSDDDDEPIQIQQGQRSRRSTGASFTYDDHQADGHWDESEGTEDPAYDNTLKGFAQMSVKHAIPEVRGLTSPKHMRTPSSSSASSRFPDGRNPFDLDADHRNNPSGLTSPSSNNRLSTLSQDSSISNRSSIGSIGGSRLQPPGVSRLPGSSAASGLKAPVSRLAQPGARSSTGVPQPASKSGLARPSGLQAPKSGLQAPKSGLQAPKSGLQAPRTASGLQAPRTGSSSSLVKPSAGGRTTGAGAATGSRLVAPGSRVPSKTGSGIAPPSTTRSQLVAPGTVKRATSALTTGRNSTLLPPSTVTSRSASSSTLLARPSAGANGSRMLTSPQRTGTGRSTPTQLVSPTRVPSGRLSSASSYMISPTSSQSSTSSLPSLAHARDTVTPLSQRLSNATGTTSQLMRPKAAGGATRSLSMYGSSSSLLPTSGRTSQQHYYHQQQEEEADYTVLTPPQSPSSKRVIGSGVPRSGMAMPSRLAAPSVSTSRVPRSSSPAPLSAGSNSGGSSYLPRPHTPTLSRIPGGLVSPRAGRS
ncbi:hypothetical protein BGZ96_006017 [Linnemannia gamsii]|uniref:Uncharacterized protein n=1 Tax=Linnemannia gamsii TaxID=64522 RepID=A0ABQ7KF83_9FUNG|nr:hypothetical protein BGZ96_006017 [Linnemannia gamsii]